MLLESGIDQFQSSGWYTGKNVQAGKIGTGSHMIWAKVYGGLVKLRGFANLRQLFIDHTQLEARLGVDRGNLQRVLKLDAGLFKISRGQVGLPFFKVPRFARLRAAAGAKRQGRHAQCPDAKDSRGHTAAWHKLIFRIEIGRKVEVNHMT